MGICWHLADFSGQELVNLAEWLYPYDDGELYQIIMEGDKDKGTDLHSLNAKICGISRSDAKTVVFGLLYGSSTTLTGYTILGSKPYSNYTTEEWQTTEAKLAKRIVYVEADPGVAYYPIKKDLLVKFNNQLITQAIFGAHIQTKIKANMRGLNDLEADIKKEVQETGGVTLPFGRFISADSDHKGLNYKCQGLGGLAIKCYQRIIHSEFTKAGLQAGKHFRLQATIYDEVDMIVHPQYVATVAEILRQAYPQTSIELGLRTRYTGEVLLGGISIDKDTGEPVPNNWAGCH